MVDCITVVPEVIVAKQSVVVGLFNGYVDGSRSVHVLHQVADVDGLVCRWWCRFVDDKQLQQQA